MKTFTFVPRTRSTWNYLKTLNCTMQTFRCSSRRTCLNQYFHWSPKAVVICLSVQWFAPNVTLHASTAKKPVAKIVNFRRLFLVLCSTFTYLLFVVNNLLISLLQSLIWKILIGFGHSNGKHSILGSRKDVLCSPLFLYLNLLLHLTKDSSCIACLNKLIHSVWRSLEGADWTEKVR